MIAVSIKVGLLQDHILCIHITHHTMHRDITFIVQGVAYLRKTLVPARDKGGFLFFPNGTQEGVVIVPAQFNTAIIVDGSEVVHATESYKPDSAPPIYDKSAKNELKFLGDGKWAVCSMCLCFGCERACHGCVCCAVLG